MATKYNILRHQVVPILQDAGNETNALITTAKNVKTEVEGMVGACKSPLVSGALEGYGSYVLFMIEGAVTKAGRVIGAGVTATKDYVQADYHMTAHAHHVLREAIPTPLQQKLDNMR